MPGADSNMKSPAYTIYDVKAEINLTPVFHRNDATAMRWFTGLVNEPEHPFHHNPEDYSLWSIGLFDAEARELTGELPKLLAEGAHVKATL